MSETLDPKSFSTPHDGKHKHKPVRTAAQPEADAEARALIREAVRLVGVDRARGIVRDFDDLAHLRRRYE